MKRIFYIKDYTQEDITDSEAIERCQAAASAVDGEKTIEGRQGTVLCLFAGSRDACPYKPTISDFTNTGTGFVVTDKKRLHLSV